MHDPIAELFESLERDGGPSGTWVLRWSAGGREPFAAAWSASHDIVAMAQILEVLDHAVWLDANATELVRMSTSIPDGWSFGDSDALRFALREPPTLGAVVAACRIVGSHRHGSVRPVPPAPTRDTVAAPPPMHQTVGASRPPALPSLR
jgi:hypothetical protein